MENIKSSESGNTPPTIFDNPEIKRLIESREKDEIRADDYYYFPVNCQDMPPVKSQSANP